MIDVSIQKTGEGQKSKMVKTSAHFGDVVAFSMGWFPHGLTNFTVDLLAISRALAKVDFLESVNSSLFLGFFHVIPTKSKMC